MGERRHENCFRALVPAYEELSAQYISQVMNFLLVTKCRIRKNFSISSLKKNPNCYLYALNSCAFQVNSFGTLTHALVWVNVVVNSVIVLLVAAFVLRALQGVIRNVQHHRVIILVGITAPKPAVKKLHAYYRDAIRAMDEIDEGEDADNAEAGDDGRCLEAAGSDGGSPRPDAAAAVGQTRRYSQERYRRKEGGASPRTRAHGRSSAVPDRSSGRAPAPHAVGGGPGRSSSIRMGSPSAIAAGDPEEADERGSSGASCTPRQPPSSPASQAEGPVAHDVVSWPNRKAAVQHQQGAFLQSSSRILAPTPRRTSVPVPSHAGPRRCPSSPRPAAPLTARNLKEHVLHSPWSSLRLELDSSAVSLADRAAAAAAAAGAAPAGSVHESGASSPTVYHGLSEPSSPRGETQREGGAPPAVAGEPPRIHEAMDPEPAAPRPRHPLLREEASGRSPAPPPRRPVRLWAESPRGSGAHIHSLAVKPAREVIHSLEVKTACLAQPAALEVRPSLVGAPSRSRSPSENDASGLCDRDTQPGASDPGSDCLDDGASERSRRRERSPAPRRRGDSPRSGERALEDQGGRTGRTDPGSDRSYSESHSRPPDRLPGGCSPSPRRSADARGVANGRGVAGDFFVKVGVLPSDVVAAEQVALYFKPPHGAAAAPDNREQRIEEEEPQRRAGPPQRRRSALITRSEFTAPAGADAAGACDGGGDAAELREAQLRMAARVSPSLRLILYAHVPWFSQRRVHVLALVAMLLLCVLCSAYPARNLDALVNAPRKANQANRRRFLQMACTHLVRELALADGFARLAPPELAAGLRWALDALREADDAARLGGRLGVGAGGDVGINSVEHNHWMYDVCQPCPLPPASFPPSPSLVHRQPLSPRPGRDVHRGAPIPRSSRG